MRTPVFHSYPQWFLSGVNSWSVNLANAMREDAHFEHVMLITGVGQCSIPELDSLGIRYMHLSPTTLRSNQEAWRLIKGFLEERSPCIYIPNYDFRRSCAAPTFSPRVKICSVVHSDEECYYDEVARLGSSFDAIVPVSSHLRNTLRQRHPKLQDRILWIPYGVPAAGERTSVVGSHPSLQLFYCNRIAQYQKRVFDLPEVCSELARLGVDFRLTVAGAGPDEEELRRRFARKNLNGRVHMAGRLSGDEVRRGFLNSDIFLLTSDFEGLPISLLESIAAGCVPVVYDMDSGVRDVIDDGVNGLIVPRGDFRVMAAVIAGLAVDRERLADLSAMCAVRHSGSFSLEAMASAYQAVFQGLMQGKGAPSVRDGRIRVPRDLTICYKIARKLGLTQRLAK